MGIMIDIIIIALIVLSAYLGYKKGLIALGVKLVAFIIAILVTVVLYKPVSNLVINVTGIDEAIENKIMEEVSKRIKDEQTDPSITNELIQSAKEGSLPQAARELSRNIVSAGVMIVLYIGTRILLRFVTALANIVTKLPILKQFNEMGGLLYGFLKGLLIIYVILLFIRVAGKVNPMNTVHQTISQTQITKMMYENNILDVFFGN